MGASCGPHSDPNAFNDPHRLRLAFRGGLDLESTARLAPGYVQGNLVILPAAHAHDFEAYCRANPKACPILAVSKRGEPILAQLGRDLDVRTDIARYRVWREGSIAAEPQDISELWNEDLVAFVLGCSYSFEQALVEAGIRLKHWERAENSPYYATDVDTVPAGPFRGKLIVSMRALPLSEVDRACAITARYPTVHGSPVHVGDPAAIGIKDLDRPRGGTPMEVAEGETPVFWACGVTPENAIMNAGLPFCITHKPGAMVVTDLLNKSLEKIR
jgi:uncharacterized protein YcsI (UPF0317 family)